MPGKKNYPRGCAHLVCIIWHFPREGGIIMYFPESGRRNQRGRNCLNPQGVKLLESRGAKLLEFRGGKPLTFGGGEPT